MRTKRLLKIIAVISFQIIVLSLELILRFGVFIFTLMQLRTSSRNNKIDPILIPDRR